MISGFVTGLLLSFVGSMTPTGPIALIVLKYGMRRQNQHALFVAAAAARISRKRSIAPGSRSAGVIRLINSR